MFDFIRDVRKEISVIDSGGINAFVENGRRQA
jgi:hypothetical protein